MFRGRGRPRGAVVRAAAAALSPIVRRENRGVFTTGDDDHPPPRPWSSYLLEAEVEAAPRVVPLELWWELWWAPRRLRWCGLGVATSSAAEGYTDVGWRCLRMGEERTG